MIKVFFDLDGVLRDLEKSVFGYRVPHWDTPVDGMAFFDFIEYKGLQIVDQALPTKFYRTVHSWFTRHPEHALVILTHQPEHWKKYTERWVKEHFGNIRYSLCYVDKMMGKLKYLDDAILIDDYPGFAGNPNVIMVSKTYNKYDAAPHLRISKAAHMEHVLDYCHSEHSSIANMYQDLSVYKEGEYSCMKL